MRYNHLEIDAKWQKYWDDHKTFAVANQGTKPKYYVLDMFPYPSGNGLHVGHPKGYVGSDIVARYKRMKGFDVLHPMGWDAFGLPTERQATKEGTHPAKITERNIETFRKQLKMIGLSYDWDRELGTCNADYYKWTQWIFLKLYEKGLAYQAEVPVNWCPALNTVLANEEVKDGLYVETGDPVEKRLMKQWMLKITAYADRLIDDLDLVDWPESIKEMQRNWIGKSEGARVKFAVAGSDATFEVFTTRPDTLFGCTYCVLAPEHELVSQIVTAEQKAEVDKYVEETMKLSERERMVKSEQKTGVFTGAYAVCPVNQKEVPLWISDYVLATYGTGAVFACPAGDERDHEFAKKFNLPIIEVVKSDVDVQEEAYTGDGEHINSEFLNGLNMAEAKQKVIAWLEANNCGFGEINYRLRDWLFSRQRYWGEPIPILIDPESGETSPVDESELPIVLPHMEDFSPAPDGQPPLAKVSEWVNTTVNGKKILRETNTMPQWAGSCWYYLRFIDPHNENALCASEAEKRFMPVDLYIGGTEHATLHLLYARFWHKVLYDIGVVSTKEPFQKLFNQGMILARSYKDSMGKYYYPYEVKEVTEGNWVSKEGEKELISHMEKMSKSKHNVVTPEEVVEEYGADTLRLYEMFMGALEDTAIWQTENISGIRRFLDKVWRLFGADDDNNDDNKADYSAKANEFEIILNQSIKKITEDLENLRMNTAISQLMILVNEINKIKQVPAEVLSIFLRLLAPFAPHICEELWQKTGNNNSVAHAEWPAFDPAKTEFDQVEIPVQVNGKLRALIKVARGAAKETVETIAKEEAPVQKHLDGKNIIKVIFVPNKMLNFVVK